MRVRRATKSDRAVAPMPAMTAKGSVRSPGEREALKVTLTIAGTDVALRSGDLELGTWQTSDVEISAVDATRFTFVAEGDRLIFTADDPMDFASHPLVRPYPGSREADDRQPKRKRKRKRKRRQKPSETTAEPSEELVVSQSDEATAIEPAPSHDDLGRTADVSLEGLSTEPDEVPTPPVVAIPTEIEDQEGPDATALGGIDDDPSDDTAPHEDAIDKDMDQGTRPGPWIRTLDMARRNGLFGLDRVQVAEGLRGEEHQHTFDHGAAAGYGPSKHICTICGKVRLRP